MAESLYQQRLEQGKCTYSGGCRSPPAPDSSLCVKHHKGHKRRNRDSAQRKRDARKAAGLCVYCPGQRPARAVAGGTSCLACRIRRNRLNGTTVDGIGNAVDNRKAARIAAATVKGEDGRLRYHGQKKKGMQPAIQLDDQDIGYARDMLDSGQAGLHLYEEAVAARAPRFQRDDIKSAALYQVNRAIGHLENVLEHRGFFDDRPGHARQRHGRREGE